MNSKTIKNNFRDSYYNNLVRKNIIGYRKINELTQANLAEYLGYTTDYIAKIESSKLNINCPINILVDISKLFQISITDLLIENEHIPHKTSKLIKIKHNEKEIYNIIRENIRQFRRFKGRSQKELSQNIGHSHNFIARLENKTRNQTISLATLGRIADILEIPIINFFSKQR